MSLFSKTAETDDGTLETSDFQRKPLGALLVDAGLIDDGQLAEALQEGTQTGERLGELVVRRGWVTEDEVARLLADQWDLDYVDRASIWFDADALGRLSREDAQRLEALPVRVEGDQVVVAVAEPTEQRLAELRKLIGDEAIVVVVPKTALDAGIRSELLSSRGSATEEPNMSEEQTAEDWEADLASGEPGSDEPTVLHAVPPGGVDLSEVEASAKNIVEFIAGHAATVRDYEQRIAALEQELTTIRATTADAKTQLAAVMDLVDALKPAV